jgi:hypothetical protein
MVPTKIFSFGIVTPLSKCHSANRQVDKYLMNLLKY